MTNSIQHCGILIIAAGQSKRLGSPKQLLAFEGKTLINRLIDIVKDATNSPITIVLGADAEKISAQITAPNLNIVMNDQWEEGMASSIRVGLNSMMNINEFNNEKLEEKNKVKEGMNKVKEELDGVMILVCDQPFVSAENIQALIQLQQNTELPIAACYYEGIIGTPAIFHKSMFSELLDLKGDIGAKKIIKNRETEVAKLHFEKGVLDIDTMEDYKQLLKEVLLK